VAALVIGLVIGGGGVGAVWALTGSGSEAGPEADARAACGALDRFDESKLGVKGAPGDVALNRWGAAEVLSTAAAAGDARHKPLADAVRQSRLRYITAFKLDAKAKEELAEARRICASL